ncbi:cytochrome c [Pseudomonas sp. Q2-TVG4-2]|uniref:c-type cytochrome n=1 Tax=Pseudomonas sp. Q2-TVG4-2 TaxID=1685699 RepID=UPI0015E72C93|nr:cytochrome c [Pseudomonas sp. Q2-TVG4-2]
MKRIIISFAAFCALGLLVVAGVVFSGLISVAADDPHTGAVHAFLETARNRSIEVRSEDIAVPSLDDEDQIRAGAGNYDSMCVGCHLAPGMAETELSNGLYPAPPNLAEAGIYDDPAKTFWVIKHGIKATGMPAWGKSMADPYIWGMVAFLQKLPDLDEGAYRALVASSGGHQHGGGETQHGEMALDDHHQGDSGGSDHHGSSRPGGATGQSGSGHHGGKESDDHHASHQPQTAEHSTDNDRADAEGKSPSKHHAHADGKQHEH